MKTLFSIGPLLVLLSGIVPLEHLEVWLAGAPVCRMACAGTEHCCCKRRQQARKSGWLHRETRPTVTEAPDGPTCPDNCATASAGQRTPPTRSSYQVEIARPVRCRPFDASPAVTALRSGLIDPTRPRAPPA